LAILVLEMAMADTLVLIAAMARLLPLVSRAQDGWRMVLRALPAHATADQLWRDLDAAAEIQGVADQPLAFEGAPDLVLERVSVRHQTTGPAALAEVSVTIPGGGHVAIVGASGAGKSTLALVLTGLMAPDDGRMRVGEVVLQGASRVAWRHRAALLAQDPVLFNESIADNLRLADPKASDAELLECLAAADAGFVRDLPDGLATLVGERGQRLSGGERQRIALARAMLGKPALLVLDPAGEARILATLQRFRPDCTVVTISHRAALTRVADTVIVLQDGRCIGTGALDQLDQAARQLVEHLGLS
jgi:ATP-binding cassette subfamily C protein